MYLLGAKSATCRWSKQNTPTLKLSCEPPVLTQFTATLGNALRLSDDKLVVVYRVKHWEVERLLALARGVYKVCLQPAV